MKMVFIFCIFLDYSTDFQSVQMNNNYSLKATG
jgi:hypothetical protein